MTQAIRFDDYAAFDALAARGYAPWGEPVAIEREAVAAFQRVTGAAGDAATIPGLMLQAMLPRLTPGHDWSVTGAKGALNLGSPAIRFDPAVPSGARLQGRSKLSFARPHPKGTLMALDFELREQGCEAPCLTSTIELLYLGEPA